MNKPRKQQVKIQLSCRISPLARTLVSLERDTGGWESDGEAVEALILRASTSPEAYQLMLEQAGKDPLFAALRHAMAANKGVNSPPNSNAHTVEQLAKVVNPLAGSAIKPPKPPKARRPEAPSVES
jgi:hypothetical protein